MSENTDSIIPFKDGLVPVQGRDGWFRDPDSNAIVNCNKTQYDEYMAAYNKRRRKEQKFETLSFCLIRFKKNVPLKSGKRKTCMNVSDQDSPNSK